ncbi:HNH endonuclease signature motif containing protein [Polaromonas sp.]|uniref:HNH endonuclease signature motif containing protein n=1 Tax=Polaromonas sp. TaxID=1869339 RepID=UPI0037505CA8
MPLWAEARIERSAAEVLAFKRHNPCPVTGLARGSCPDWEVDHVQPLCSGGPDTRANMQWLSVEDHRAKTRSDVRMCRNSRKNPTR